MNINKLIILLLVCSVHVLYGQDVKRERIYRKPAPTENGYIYSFDLLYKFFWRNGVSLNLAYDEKSQIVEGYQYNGKIYTQNEIDQKYFNLDLELLDINANIYHQNNRIITNKRLKDIWTGFRFVDALGLTSEYYKNTLNEFSIEVINIDMHISPTFIWDACKNYEKEKQYESIVQEAERLNSQGKQEEALEKYNEAGKLFYGRQEVKLKIKEIKEKIEKANQYNSLLASGDEAYNSGYFKSALDKYKDAKNINNTSEINDKIFDTERELYDKELEEQQEENKSENNTELVLITETTKNKTGSGNIESEEDSDLGYQNQSDQDYYFTDEVLKNGKQIQPNYGIVAYENYLAETRRIEQRAQYMREAIDKTVGGILDSYYAVQSFNERVSGIQYINVTSRNPQELIRQVNAKKQELVNEYNREQERLVREYQQKMLDMQKSAQSSGEAAVAGIATIVGSASLRNSVEKEKREALEDLEYNYRLELDKIKNEIITENETAKEKYNTAVIRELDKNKENYYEKKAGYHSCIINHINDNYSYESDYWYNHNCKDPGNAPYSKKTFSFDDYMSAANRKYSKYLRTGNSEYKTYSLKFVNAALRINNNDASAYYLKYKLCDKTYDKYVNILSAYHLSNKMKYVTEYTTVKNRLSDELYKAVKNDNFMFSKKIITKNYHFDLLNDKSLIIESIKYDRYKTLQLLLDHEINKEKTLEFNGHNYLLIAAKNNSAKCANVLVMKLVNPNYKSTDGLTPFIVSLTNKNGKTSEYFYKHSNDIEYTFQYIAKTYPDYLNYLGSVIIHCDLKLGKVSHENLINKYCNKIFNKPNLFSGKPLFIEAIQANSDWIYNFVEQGAQIEDQYKGDPLIDIAYLNNSKVFIDIYKQKYPNKNVNGYSIIYKACVNGNRVQLENLKNNNFNLGALDNNKNTVLNRLVKEKNADGTKMLSKHKDSGINQFNNDGMTPLHLAIYNNDSRTVNILLSNGADPNKKCKRGWAPLHYAVKIENIEIARNLISYKANKNEKNSQGLTPEKMAKKMALSKNFIKLLN